MYAEHFFSLSPCFSCDAVYHGPPCAHHYGVLVFVFHKDVLVTQCSTTLLEFPLDVHHLKVVWGGLCVMDVLWGVDEDVCGCTCVCTR